MPKRASDFDRLLGARLRAARIERSMTQHGIGELLGLTFQQIQKYENGRTRVSSCRLVEFAKHYRRPIDWFLSGIAESVSNGEHEPDLGARLLDAAAGRELAEAFLAIDDGSARLALVRLAKKLAAGAPAQQLQAAE